MTLAQVLCASAPIAAFVLALGVGQTARADTITVCASGCDYSDIQQAINASANGDVIEIAAGTYAPPATLSTNGKAITLRGELNLDGTPATVIGGQGVRQVFNFSSGEGPGTILENLLIAGGKSAYGGGLYLYQSSPTLTHCHVIGNLATSYGGGLYIAESDPILTDCHVSGNSVTGTFGQGGGLYLSYSQPTLVNCHVSGNTSFNYGGGLFAYRSGPTLTDCVLCANQAIAGPQIYLSESALLGEGNCFAFSCEDSDGDGSPDKCTSVGDSVHEVPGEYATIEEAIASAGAGDLVLIAAGTYTPAITLNTKGKAITIRGAVNADGTPATVVNAQGWRQVIRIDNGEGPATVFENLVITGGAGVYGGGVNISYSSPTLANCVVSGNTATSYGGGLFLLWASPTVANCVFCGNTAPTSPQVYGSTGTWTNTCIADSCDDCAPVANPDFNGDGLVDGADLGLVLGAWGMTDPPTGDATGDGVVDGADLSAVLSAWGSLR